MDPDTGISGFWAVFGLGAFGGLAVEIFRWYQLRQRKTLPQYARHYFFWIMTVAMIVVGGVLACLYGLKGRNPMAVVQLVLCHN